MRHHSRRFEPPHPLPLRLLALVCATLAGAAIAPHEGWHALGADIHGGKAAYVAEAIHPGAIHHVEPATASRIRHCWTCGHPPAARALPDPISGLCATAPRAMVPAALGGDATPERPWHRPAGRAPPLA